MRTVIARIFDYSLDGVIAQEGTAFFDFCRDVIPDDQVLEDHTRAFYEGADVHIMGRKHYEDAAQYFPQADDHPYAAAMNAARKIVFSHTITTADWANTSVATGDLTAEMEKLKLDGDGYIVAHGGVGFWQSLIRDDLIDEYRLSLFPYLAVGQGTRLFDLPGPSPRLEPVSATPFGNGVIELVFRRLR
jgi:dihydrofolate reductase